jgi:hypothetical protein
MADLYELLKARQDELRGRPENWRDRFGDWLAGVDWMFVGLATCIVIWGACETFIAVAQFMLDH